MGVFKGIRTKNGAFVTYNNAPLDLRLDLKDHSPMGFEWGYNGSGPKQLALSILAQFSSHDSILEYYETFSKEFIEPLIDDEWELNGAIVRKWMNKYSLTVEQPILTSGFKLIKNNDNAIMYLDGYKLGTKFDIALEYNTTFEDNKYITYCHFSEISHLATNHLPENLTFEFMGPFGNGFIESKVNDILGLDSLSNSNGKLTIIFWLHWDIEDYNGYKNPKVVIQEFLESLEKIFIDFNVKYNRVEDVAHVSSFSFVIKDEDNDLDTTVQNVIDSILNIYKDVYGNSNTFEAIFNLPEEYQSILKPYMLYFEEFLHDLCIESDVNIRKEGVDTILSVEPKNKDEALVKIANALKMYLSAPIAASNVNIEQKLQMQVALQKLHAECSHMESQLILKSAVLNTHKQQLITQNEIISETKRILVEVGINPQIITENNILLLESLKEIKFNNKDIKKKTFIDSFKGKLKVAGVFETSIEVSTKELENKQKDDK